MSQHDYDVANGSGAAVRSDLNALAGAIASLNSATTAPSTTFAYMLWADTTTGILKQRNAANSAWVSLLTMSTGAPAFSATALSVLGRATNSAGVPADIVASNDGDVLRRSGTTLGFGTIAFSQLASKPTTIAGYGITDGGIFSGYRNKVINGDFPIWQRYTSVVMTGGGTFGPDRWLAGGSFTGGTSVTCSRQTHTLGQTAVPGNPKYFMRWDRTTTGSSSPGPMQKIEGVETFAGKTVTVTFYAKANTGSKSVSCEVTQSFGTGGSPSADVNSSAQSYVLTTSWAKYTYVVALASIAGKTLGSNGNDHLFALFSQAQASGNFQFDISHVSIVDGDATAEIDPFSPRHIGQELALCKRYFRKTFAPDTAPAQNVGSGTGEHTWKAVIAGANYSSMDWRFDEPMRTTPTITFYSPSSAAAQAYVASVGVCTNTGATMTPMGGLVFAQGHASTVANSQVGVHMTADAEL